MPILDNPRHERFAQELAKGRSATEAYALAGYSPNDGNAARLKGNDKIVARVSEIQAKGAEMAEITVERVLRELGKVGFSNMADYMKVGPNGDPYLDFSALTRDQAAALQEVTVDDFVDGRGEDAREVRRVKFKLADKLGALDKIGRHLGMFTDKIEMNGSLDIGSALQAARRRARMRNTSADMSDETDGK